MPVEWADVALLVASLAILLETDAGAFSLEAWLVVSLLVVRVGVALLVT